MDVAVGGGVESISMNRTAYVCHSDELMVNKPALYMAAIETAEIVGERYGVSREVQMNTQVSPSTRLRLDKWEPSMRSYPCHR